MTEKTSINIVREISDFIKENKKSLLLTLGKVSEIKQIDQGGNGLVYGGIQNKSEVAIKFWLRIVRQVN
ncbi:hypothetical protein [Alteribacter keqinensis]|uniref:Uncharacterized protein n=1 Tax=Alteribacter keqinensis TaxID=2483800 RepID=A0A3M7TTE4_9BACI|nr:hypothetical protein [Alteribacter keqinensis]RNA68559.1 hypothetical protein EBO34_00880 [Alteribacter keqinensis]